MPTRYYPLFSFLFLWACTSPPAEVAVAEPPTPTAEGVQLIVLGTVQDAGSPHIACKKACCQELFEAPDPTRQVTTLGLVDVDAGKQFLFEASPDISRQTKKLRAFSGQETELPDGIFLTHAHIGHYTGLMYLGREATNADETPVYAMPGMQQFLKNNGPWSQLVAVNNISLQPLRADSTIILSPGIKVTPFRVPHRDEFSETVGYRIEGPAKSALFIPDIDKWERWDRSIDSLITTVDVAFVDGTFFNGAELNTRDISQIPHPFVSESIERLSELPVEERAKVTFIHFNHTNRLLDASSAEYAAVLAAGMQVAEFGDVFSLD